RRWALASAVTDRLARRLRIGGGMAPGADGRAWWKERMQAAGETVSEEAWAQARQEFLAGERQLPPETLGQLAAQRGRTVQQLLEDTHGVPSDQLFTLDPTRQAQLDEQGNVNVPFTLDVRLHPPEQENPWPVSKRELPAISSPMCRACAGSSAGA